MMIRALLILSILTLTEGAALAQGDTATIFAVVTKVPRDRSQVPARILAGGQVADSMLIAADEILGNPIWRTLEICHSLKAEAWKTPGGYRLASVKVVDSGMLPMELQGVAGDCLLRKALDIAPLAD
jgi:hypothetical protein